VLRLAHPTLSSQIHALEDRLGEKLFERVGRRLVLTEVGRVAYRYADEIFNLGREMVDVVHGRPSGRPQRLDVGIVDVVPKMIVRYILDPALDLQQPLRLVCHEDTLEVLLHKLANHELDVVIADSPAGVGSSVRAFSHLLGESGVTFFGAMGHESLAQQFPASLDRAPMLLPLEGSLLRRALDHWFTEVGVQPMVVAECEDSALTKILGADGLGVFTAPTAVEEEVSQRYGAAILGRIATVRERFYAISIERRIKNPAVVAICDNARLFLGERLVRKPRAVPLTTRLTPLKQVTGEPILTGTSSPAVPRAP
jgi:LysR family transcriptional activator of nhaA